MPRPPRGARTLQALERCCQPRTRARKPLAQPAALPGRTAALPARQERAERAEAGAAAGLLRSLLGPGFRTRPADPRGYSPGRERQRPPRGLPRLSSAAASPAACPRPVSGGRPGQSRPARELHRPSDREAERRKRKWPSWAVQPARAEVAVRGEPSVQMAGAGRRMASPARLAGPGRPGQPQERRHQPRGKQRSGPRPGPRRWVSPPFGAVGARGNQPGERRREGAALVILDEVRDDGPLGSRSASQQRPASPQLRDSPRERVPPGLARVSAAGLAREAPLPGPRFGFCDSAHAGLATRLTPTSTPFSFPAKERRK